MAVGTGADGGEDPAGGEGTVDGTDGDPGQVDAEEGRARDQGHARTGRGEGDDRAEVVGGVHQARLETGVLAGQQHHVVARVARVGADPRFATEVGHRDRTLGGGQRVGERKNCLEGLGIEGDAGEPGVVGPRGTAVLDGHGEVGATVEQHRQAGVALGVEHLEPDAGGTGGEGSDGGREDEGDAGGEGGHGHFARDAGAVGGEVGLGPFQLGEDGVGMTEQDLPGRREPHASALAGEQMVAGLLLQGGQLLRDGGGGEVERGRRGGHRPVVRHRSQGPQPSRVDHRPILPASVGLPGRG